MLTDANRKVSIIAYFLSEYNEDALRALGYSTYTDAFRCLSALFGKTKMILLKRNIWMSLLLTVLIVHLLSLRLLWRRHARFA